MRAERTKKPPDSHEGGGTVKHSYEKEHINVVYLFSFVLNNNEGQTRLH